MADKKPTGPAAARAAAIAARVPMRAYDPADPNMTEKTTVRIPVDRVNAGNVSMVVGLNGVFYTIRRGKPVQVPKAVADIVRHSLEQDDRTLQYIESLPNAAEPEN